MGWSISAVFSYFVEIEHKWELLSISNDTRNRNLFVSILWHKLLVRYSTFRGKFKIPPPDSSYIIKHSSAIDHGSLILFWYRVARIILTGKNSNLMRTLANTGEPDSSYHSLPNGVLIYFLAQKSKVLQPISPNPFLSDFYLFQKISFCNI